MKDLYYDIKYFFEKLFRGYSGPECWNLYSATAKYMYPRFLQYRKYRQGNPMILEEEAWSEKQEEAWDKVLDKIQFAIEFILYNDTNYNKKGFREEFIEKYGDIYEEKEEYKQKPIKVQMKQKDGTYKEEELFSSYTFYYNKELDADMNKRTDEGLELLGRWFRHLWD